MRAIRVRCEIGMIGVMDNQSKCHGKKQDVESCWRVSTSLAMLMAVRGDEKAGFDMGAR
ncbi:hypothetical protein [Photobacterium swingsii]|uniref:hypothetical protein n=1 Tax=Photobacterium swingsii TaxID=680026 RepID=UPI000A54FF89|nr:hypothetical protein [Photobacterium swingsii]